MAEREPDALRELRKRDARASEGDEADEQYVAGAQAMLTALGLDDLDGNRPVEVNWCGYGTDEGCGYICNEGTDYCHHCGRDPVEKVLVVRIAQALTPPEAD